MKRLYVFLVVISLMSLTFGQNIAINEFLADNETVVADQDGEYDDWIELYNNGTDPVSMNGYYLSDDSSDLTQWKFPDTII